MIYAASYFPPHCLVDEHAAPVEHREERAVDRERARVAVGGRVELPRREQVARAPARLVHALVNEQQRPQHCHGVAVLGS